MLYYDRIDVLKKLTLMRQANPKSALISKKNLIANLSTIKFHGDKVTNFHNKEIPYVDSNHTCLAVIILDSALKEE